MSHTTHPTLAARIRTLAALTSLAIATTVAAQVQPFDGSIRIESRAGDLTKVAFDGDGSLLGGLRFAINYGGSLCDKLTATLGAPGAIVPGQTLYDIDCTEGPYDSMAILPDPQTMALQYKMAGVSVTFTSTQPWVGQWGDPRFSLTFDLDVHVALPRPSLPIRGLTIGDVQVSVSNAHIDSHNVIGDAVGLVGTIYEMCTGNHVDAFVQQVMNDRLPTIQGLANGNIGMVVMNAILKDLYKAGFKRFDWGFDGHALVLSMTSRIAIPYSAFAKKATRIATRTTQWADDLAQLPDAAVASALLAQGPGAAMLSPTKLATAADAADVSEIPPPPPARVFVNPLDLVALNPQPLPPRIVVDVQAPGALDPSGPVALNPQPLPPRDLGVDLVGRVELSNVLARPTPSYLVTAGSVLLR